MKKTAAVLTAILMIWGLISGAVCYAAETESGSLETGVTWSFDGSRLALGGSGDVPDYSQVNKAPWQKYAASVKTVTVGEGVTALGSRAFYGFSALEEVVFSNAAVSKIGNYCFYGCKSLKNITLPNGVKTVGSRAFYRCSALTAATLPDSTETVGDSAFAGCTLLSQLSLGSGLLSIGDGAFEECESLLRIVLPENLSTIGEDAFSLCGEGLSFGVFHGSYGAKYCDAMGYDYDILCKVSYYSDDELVKTVGVKYGERLTFPSDFMKKEGYVLSGWTISSGRDSYVIIADDSVEIKGNIKASIIWERLRYLVIYDLTGGSGKIANSVKYHDEALTLTKDVPEKEGFDFLGWATSAESGEVTYKSGDQYTANEPITLYAVWAEKTYTVSYNANGGTADIPPMTKRHFSVLQITDVQPRREGFTFMGWAKNPEAVVCDYSPGSLLSENGDLTLYAVWREGIVKGDADNDSKITISDLFLMINRLNGVKTELSADAEAAMDTNGDTYFNIKDVLKLTQFLAGWENIVLGESTVIR